MNLKVYLLTTRDYFMIVISELDCSYINGAGGGVSEALHGVAHAVEGAAHVYNAATGDNVGEGL
ncbi:TPA: hypothetical protein ACWO74_005119, partial [Salmonella enterica subsp. enterica serovar Muenchen]